jgi:hypothetical protein
VGLVAAVVPPLAPLVMAPCAAGTRWVSTIAYLAADAEPSPRVAAIGWLLVVAGVAALVVRYHWRHSPDDVPI